MRECYSKALAAWAEADYKTALSEYLKNLIMSTEAERMQRYEKEFCKLLTASELAGVDFQDRNGKLQNLLYPRSALVLYTLATLKRTKDPFDSMDLYKKAFALCGGLDRIVIYGHMLNIRSHIVSTWHIGMVNDLARNEAYEAAMRKLITSDMKVIDVGTGTGLLAMIAAKYCRTGLVVGLEGQPGTCSLAERSVARNGLEHLIQIHEEMSSEYEPEFIPDLIISETMDCGGLGEKILQIFLDVHQRYTHGNAKCLFIPNKLSFHVILAQSDSFWRSRYHKHSCRQLGCPSTCYYSGFDEVLISYHPEPNTSYDASYTALRPSDWEDLQYLSDKVEICETQLDDVRILERLKAEGLTRANFQIPLKQAGRVDVVLLCWRAHLAEDVTMDSMGQAMWEYAAFPMHARVEYQEGDNFHGQYTINFESGLTIEQRFVGVLDPYHETPHLHREEEDGVIELVNNKCLERYLSSQPHRLYSWLESGLDPYWPFNNEGHLRFRYLEKVAKARRERVSLEHDTINRLTCNGCLFRSDAIARRARQDPTKTVGVDLGELDAFSLVEYKEIRRAFNGTCDWTSDAIVMFDIDTRGDHGEIVPGNTFRFPEGREDLKKGGADGFLYWWSINGGEFDNRAAGLPVAAMLFDTRITQMGLFNFYLNHGEMLCTYNEGFLTARDPRPPLPPELLLQQPFQLQTAVAAAAAASQRPPQLQQQQQQARTTDV